MERRFSGWPTEAYDVLLRLDGEPSPAVRDACRKDRERLVREPMVDLCQDLADLDSAYDDFYVWSFHDKPWPWQHQCAGVRIARQVYLSLRFDLDGLYVRGGWSYPDPGQVDRFRAAVDDDRAGPRLQRIVDELRDQGFEIVDPTLMTRGPRGYPADHPRAGLLRHRALLAGLHLGCDDWLHTPAVVDRVHDVFIALAGLLSWLSEHAAAGLDPSGKSFKNVKNQPDKGP